MIMLLKILTPKVMKGIMSYVFEKNDLDHKVDKIIERQQEDHKRLIKVEKIAHEPREFVKCKQCQERIEEANKLTQSLGDETI